MVSDFVCNTWSVENKITDDNTGVLSTVACAELQLSIVKSISL